MIRTVFTIDNVPTSWIFEYYCKLEEKLHGQEVKIKSIFTYPEERSASMGIYCKKGKYEFKDFSSGYKGDAVELVKLIYKIKYLDAITKILNDYSKVDKTNDEEIIVTRESKFKVASYKTRGWNENDVKFWTPFGIGSTLLNKYNVKALSEFTLQKDGYEPLHISGQHIYGYFKSNGELHKIYQPHKKDYKFFNVLPYIQGSDQITYSKPTLIICSSLKDMMSLDALTLEVECVAPNSENSMLTRPVLSAYALKYEKIFTLFDNDNAGHNSMIRYEEMYGIPGIYLNMSKDLSDSVRDFGIAKTKQYLSPLIEIA